MQLCISSAGINAHRATCGLFTLLNWWAQNTKVPPSYWQYTGPCLHISLISRRFHAARFVLNSKLHGGHPISDLNYTKYRVEHLSLTYDDDESTN